MIKGNLSCLRDVAELINDTRDSRAHRGAIINSIYTRATTPITL